MQAKFNPTYRILIQKEKSQEFLEIAYPFTIDFDISRDTSSSVNQATFKIYNLNENTRSQLFKDRYSLLDYGTGTGYRKIIFQAGYGGQLTTCFVGAMLQAHSYRSGTEMVTHIQALDGGYAIANSQINTSFGKGVSVQTVLESLSGSLFDIQQGAVSDTSGTLNRGIVFNGNAWGFLTETFSDKEVFIDMQELYILNRNDATKTFVPLISAETGLLGTPMRESTNLTVDIIFEPRVKVGNIVEIKSTTNPFFNGQFKITGIKHNGTISASVSGTRKTTLILFVGSLLFGSLKVI